MPLARACAGLLSLMQRHLRLPASSDQVRLGGGVVLFSTTLDHGPFRGGGLAAAVLSTPTPSKRRPRCPYRRMQVMLALGFAVQALFLGMTPFPGDEEATMYVLLYLLVRTWFARVEAHAACACIPCFAGVQRNGRDGWAGKARVHGVGARA